MCARLGIRQAFSQAYHHQANGRAEMSGQLLLERLRKLNTARPINWVEALPQVLDRYHDTPGVSGLSPYQIMFGRERSIGQRPYTVATECEDAQDFFKRMETIDKRVAKILNERHIQRAKSTNVDRTEPHTYNPGDVVWYLRPPGSGGKLDTRWLGPCKVLSREGEYSYTIQVTPKRSMAAHATFLKPHIPDKYIGEPTSMYSHRHTQVETDLIPDE